MTLRISLMILAGALFLACSSHHTKPPPQQPPPPIADFQKYTYLLCFKKTNQQKPVGWCSGFLVKLDSDIYCVTNYRLVDGVDVFSGKLNPPDQQFDSLLFRYSTKSGRVRYISFPMHQGGGPPFYYFERSDFVLFKLPPSPDTPVYNVCNKWIYQYDTADGTPDSVFLYGYNGEKYIGSKGPVILDTMHPDLYNEKMYYDISAVPFRRYSGMDEITHSNLAPDSLNFEIKPRASAGQNGCPVFFVYNKPGGRKITFGGVLVGSLEDVSEVTRREGMIYTMDSIKKNIPVR